jgi:hypothetical protein
MAYPATFSFDSKRLTQSSMYELIRSWSSMATKPSETARSRRKSEKREKSAT